MKQCLGCQRKADEGYYQTRLTTENSISKTELVHRLVANAFIPNVDNKPTVNHKDGNKNNNYVDNLEWATNSEQMDHAYNNSLRFDNKYIAQIDIFTNEIIETYISIHEASRKNNVNISNIHSVCNGTRNHAGGFKWKYINNKNNERNQNMKEKIYFSKTKPNAIIPSKRDSDAGYDIYACFEEDFILLHPHQTKMIPTGIASACSSDYYFQLLERGSTGTKGIGQRCGVIDSGYRNEWFVPITNHNNQHLVIRKQGVTNIEIWGDTMPNNVINYPYEKAICQAVLLPVPKVEINEIDYDELLNITSERGLGNLGSTNK